MIFASLGTMDMEFSRMARAIDEFAATTHHRVVVQSGYTRYNYKYAESFDFATHAQMQELLRSADVVILQGGWGAISEAMELKKRIVVIPRHNHTEHIHDQFQLVRKLDSKGCIIGAFDESELSKKIDQALGFNFQQLQRGNAEEIIREQLATWFGQ